METLDSELKTKLNICLTQQMTELELLKSMYPNDTEIIFNDKCILKKIQQFIENTSDFTPNRIDFVLNIFLINLKLEIFINLPLFYPEEEIPDLHIRCNQLPRQLETDLNKDVKEFLVKNHIGEVCLYSVISWLTDNIEAYSPHTLTESVSETAVISKINNQKFARFWIFSHHIYNKKKREEIVAQANNLKLTGFCLPGKPGVICIEGPEDCCYEWWRIIKSMNWKKITIRKIESFDITQQQENQKFQKFNEIYFTVQSSQCSKHSDMSSFNKFMVENDFSHIFGELFGLHSET